MDGRTPGIGDIEELRIRGRRRRRIGCRLPGAARPRSAPLPRRACAGERRREARRQVALGRERPGAGGVVRRLRDAGIESEDEGRHELGLPGRRRKEARRSGRRRSIATLIASAHLELRNGLGRGNSRRSVVSEVVTEVLHEDAGAPHDPEPPIFREEGFEVFRVALGKLGHCPSFRSCGASDGERSRWNVTLPEMAGAAAPVAASARMRSRFPGTHSARRNGPVPSGWASSCLRVSALRHDQR